MDVNFVLFKNGKRHDFALPEGTTTVGRRPDCGLRVPVGNVSRTHCQVTLTANGPVVKDLGSSNGTFVNDSRINGEHLLKPGDVVKVGPAAFTVQIDGKPKEIISPDELDSLLGDDDFGSGEIGDLDIDDLSPDEETTISGSKQAAGMDGDPMDMLEELDIDDLDV